MPFGNFFGYFKPFSKNCYYFTFCLDPALIDLFPDLLFHHDRGFRLLYVSLCQSLDPSFSREKN